MNYKDIYGFTSEDLFAFYLRKSQADDPNEPIEVTLAKHKERLLGVAARYNIKEEQIMFFEEVVSGDTIAERPQVLDLLHKVSDGYFKGVFVVEIDRFSRGDSIDQGIINNTFYFSGTLIITCDKIYDIANSEADREQLEFKLFMSKREYNTINKRMYQGRVDNVKAGYYIFSITPYGYGKKLSDDKRGYILIPDEYESKIVITMFEMFLEGVGTTNLAKYLNSIKAKARKSEKWTPAMVRNILTSPVYYGGLKWGEKTTIKKMVDGQIVKKNIRRQNYNIFVGKQEPLVSRETFDLVQAKLKPNSDKKVKKNNELKNPLAGLIVCGTCLETDKVERNMFRRPYMIKAPRKALKRKFEVDKEEFLKFMRHYKDNSGLSLNEIARSIGVSKYVIDHWFPTTTKKMYLSEQLSDNWFKLKELLKIDDNRFDTIITTYEKAEPDRHEDTLLCQMSGCKNVSSNLVIVEKRLIDSLQDMLSYYNKFVNNYEEEITKLVRGNTKEINRIEKEIKKLNTRLDSVMEAYELKDYTREQFLKRKSAIEEELKTLIETKEKLEANKEEDKLIQIKKAIPKIENCIDAYYECKTPIEKNELLKTVIKKVVYTKRQGGRWDKAAINNFELKIELMFDLNI